jgi:hypothetical protein
MHDGRSDAECEEASQGTHRRLSRLGLAKAVGTARILRLEDDSLQAEMTLLPLSRDDVLGAQQA